MELHFNIEDQERFLKKIGYKVERADIMYTTDGGRYCEDETITKKMWIAYKGERPNTDLGYKDIYYFENQYDVGNVFKITFPSYLVNTITENINNEE